jgi:hypothetical protein
VLKTARDYADMMEWIALRSTRRALRARSDGVLPNLARAIVAIVMRRPVRNRPSYKHIAEVFARDTGCFVTEDHIKSIRAKRDLIPLQCVSQLSAKDIEFARAYATHPIAVEQMRSSIIPGSIAERQFSEIWEKRLPAPVLKIVSDHCDDAFASVMDQPITLVAVAGGHGAASRNERPIQMTRSSKPVQLASLADRAAIARIERVMEPAQSEQTAVVQPRPELTRLDQLRIRKWVSDRLVATWPGGCWHCRRPFIAGQKFIDVRGNEVVVRFHAQCESEWRRTQEATARRALKLIEPTTETSRP